MMANRPAPLTFVDSHAHLQEPEFASDRAAVIERALAAGVRQVILPGTDLQTTEAALELANRHPGLYATAGFHPHEAARFAAADLTRLETLLAEPRIVAVGETGLDFYRLHSPPEAQIEAFVAHLDLARSLAMPVVIHCRDAWDVLRPILDAWATAAADAFAGRPLGVLHYFDSDAATATHYAGLGFLISIHTSVTHPRAAALREAVAALPLDSLLIETDSPYGAPQAFRGKRNEPAFVVEAAKQIAALRGLPLEEVAAATAANARRLFRLPLPDSTPVAEAAR